MCNGILGRSKTLHSHFPLFGDLLHHNWQIKDTWFSIESRVERAAEIWLFPVLCIWSLGVEYDTVLCWTFGNLGI